MPRTSPVRTGWATSVVVPTYRRPDVLGETLQALLRSEERGSTEIIVVDDAADGETERTVAQLRTGDVPLRYLVAKGRGAAAARNQGAAAAEGDVLVFLDDDIVVKPDSVANLRRSLSTFQPCAVNLRWEFAPDFASQLEATPFGRYRKEVEAWVKAGLGRQSVTGSHFEVEAVTACNLAVRRDHFQRVGGFDESFPHAGAEDQEFSIRARSAGLRLILDDAHSVWHNDRRMTLVEFCDRQRRGAISAVYLAAKHPATHATRPLIVENSPLSRRDRPRVFVKKLAKRALASRPAAYPVRAVIALLEAAAPDSRVLRKAYWSLLGIAIFRGVREGWRELGDAGRAQLESVLP